MMTPSCAANGAGLRAGPVSAQERITEVDLLRGLALLGIVVVNMTMDLPWIRLIPGFEDNVWINESLYRAIDILAEGKFYLLFSFLFGLGFYIQMTRAETRKAAFVPTSVRSLDRPPAVDLRRADGALLQTLARADIDGLKALRWTPPEEFVAKAADGRTDLYGAIYKPFDFDPARKYPVIEVIYAGPMTTQVPRTFSGSTSALAHLGFIVVLMDGRGTTERGKAFQDVVYGNLGRHESPDHVAVLKQIAAPRPYMDMERVGVYGRSFGGYFAIRAMLLAPDVYRVGIAAAPIVEVYGHGSRVEPYLGRPSDDPAAYDYASNLPLAGTLEGRLLMTHGTADVNAPFSQTLKMADAFIRGNKPFDLLVLPGVAHFHEAHAARYWYDAVRRYFQQHLVP